MEPLLHFVIPFTAFLLVGFSLKEALLGSLLALAPDLDALLLIHRSFTHSLAPIASALLPTLLYLHKFKPKLQKYGLMAFFALLSHLLLDVFTGYTPLLWPFYNFSIWVAMDLTVHVGSLPNLAFNLRLLTEPITFQTARSLDAPILTGDGLTISLLTLAPALIKYAFNRHHTSR